MPAAELQETILLVDDNPTNLQVLFQTLTPLRQKLLAAKGGLDALSVAQRARPAVVLLDVMMPDLDGYETCRRLKADPVTRDASVLFLSALGEVHDKVRGLEVGAVDFITKPFQAEEVIARVKTQLTLQRLRRAVDRELAVARALLHEAQRREEGPLLGSSGAVQGLRASIHEVAPGDENVLLVGTPGSGEQAVARAIHAGSPRAAGPFLYLSCAQLENDDVGPLLGRLQPGRPDAPPGLLEVAEGGTLLLDGLRSLSTVQQDRLADVLESLAEQRRQGQIPRPDVRVIACAPHDLSALSGFSPRLGRLLAGHRVLVPSLADRGPDTLTLARHYLERHARRLGKAISGFSPATEQRLMAYRWPGSVRELEGLVERHVTLCRGPVVEVLAEDHLGGEEARGAEQRGGLGEAAGLLDARDAEVDDLEHVDLAAEPADEEVLGLDVAVDEARVVGLDERAAGLAQQVDGARGPHRSVAREQGVEAEAAQELHDEVAAVLDDAEVVERDRVGRGQVGQHHRLAPEPLAELADRVGPRRARGVHQLDRGRPGEQLVARLPDLAHAAGAELAHERVAAEDGALVER
ncbi:MAG: sigma-54-dependent Fis family transcriptional regulator, partial [Myxococcales bacterium]